MKNEENIKLDYDLVKTIIKKGNTIASMESCTGGLLASTITDVAGASDILAGSIVTYSNFEKIKNGVNKDAIDKYGVYSKQTATLMAKACHKLYATDIAVGITGSLSRPDPKNKDSIVGDVNYCVIVFGKVHNRHLTIPCSIKERSDMKKYIVNDILKKIVSLI